MTSKNQIEFVDGGYKIQENKETYNNFDDDFNFTKNTQIEDANSASDSATNLERINYFRNPIKAVITLGVTYNVGTTNQM